MRLLELISTQKNDLLLEGGAALKGTKPIKQDEALEIIPTLIKRVAGALKLPIGKVKSIGSAGKKKNASDLSGDIDIAVEASPEDIENALPELAFDGKTFRPMKGIGVYAFAFQLSNKLIQVDLMSVKNVKYATWALQAHEDDLHSNLKGAHRNELFFAVAKHANQIAKDADGDGVVDELERYFYDLTRGLYRGKQTKRGKRKLKAGFQTIEKNHITDNPKKISEILFGDGVTPEQVSTFEGTLKAIMAPGFPHSQHRDAILQMAADGMRTKGLEVPKSIKVSE